MCGSAQPCAAANGGGPSRLQSARLVAAVAELGSLGKKELRALMSVDHSKQLAQKIAQGGAPELVEAMLRSAETRTPDAEDCVADVMSSLEEMGGREPEIACCLMLALYPIASKLMMHDVCDRIDLWIVVKRSSSLADHIKRLAASESDAAMKRHLEGLLSTP